MPLAKRRNAWMAAFLPVCVFSRGKGEGETNSIPFFTLFPGSPSLKDLSCFQSKYNRLDSNLVFLSGAIFLASGKSNGSSHVAEGAYFPTGKARDLKSHNLISSHNSATCQLDGFWQFH